MEWRISHSMTVVTVSLVKIENMKLALKRQKIRLDQLLLRNLCYQTISQFIFTYYLFITQNIRLEKLDSPI